MITRCSDDLLCDPIVHTPSRSDHCAITCKLNIKKVEIERKTIAYQKTRDINIGNLMEDLQNCDLINNDDNNVDEMVACYNTSLLNLMDKHAPMITKKVCVRSRKPWYNDMIQQAKRERSAAERKWIKSQKPEDLTDLHTHRTRVIQLCSDAKKQFYRSKISENSKDQKALFQVANELLHRKKDSHLPNSDSKEELANRFVAYFIEKIEQIVNSFGKKITEQPSNEIYNGTLFERFKPITDDQLKKLIMEGNSKSCHLDPLPTKLLKQVLDAVLPVMTKIVNASLQSNFPQALKSATVVPLLKKATADKEELRNYRPVSNLSCISNLIEKVAVEQLKEHMTGNNLHESCLSAYRACHSTETALLKITNDLLSSMDKHHCVLLVMLDLSAAFDTVSHSILLTRMKEMYGMTGDAYSWLPSGSQSVSDHRWCDVSLQAPEHRTASRLADQTLRLPSIQLSTLPYSLKAWSGDAYVCCDTQLYLTFKPQEYNWAILKMEECLAEIRAWTSKNLLKLNDSKTEFMVIGKTNPLSKLPDERYM